MVAWKGVSIMAFVYAQKRLMNDAVGGKMYKKISIGFSDMPQWK